MFIQPQCLWQNVKNDQPGISFIFIINCIFYCVINKNHFLQLPVENSDPVQLQHKYDVLKTHSSDSCKMLAMLSIQEILMFYVSLKCYQYQSSNWQIVVWIHWIHTLTMSSKQLLIFYIKITKRNAPNPYNIVKQIFKNLHRYCSF